MAAMKLLSGIELAGYIKQRQASQVRVLLQTRGVKPKLAIIQTSHNPVISTYVKLKQGYGKDIQITVDVYNQSEDQLPALITKLNRDQSVHGIIIQLPLNDQSQTENFLNLVKANKDVDGLARTTLFDPATPTAINWLVAGYNIELLGKKIMVIGSGRLVGAPLAKMWQASGYNVQVLTKTEDLNLHLKQANIIVSAAGSPGLVTSAMIPIDCVVIDTGVSSDSGKTVGDIDEKVYERSDLTITPPKGGVGPLTVAALFDNVITAANR